MSDADLVAFSRFLGDVVENATHEHEFSRNPRSRSIQKRASDLVDNRPDSAEIMKAGIRTAEAPSRCADGRTVTPQVSRTSSAPTRTTPALPAAWPPVPAGGQGRVAP